MGGVVSWLAERHQVRYDLGLLRTSLLQKSGLAGLGMSSFLHSKSNAHTLALGAYSINDNMEQLLCLHRS